MVEKFGTGLKEYTVRCMDNFYFPERLEAFKKHWEAAESLDEFKKMVLEDDDLAQSHGYAEVSKETDGHWYRVRAMFGDKCFKTMCDAGAVMVSSNDGLFQTLIPSNGGDGIARVAVFNKTDSFNEYMMDFTGNSVNGEFSISGYDCEFHEVMSLSGKYFVYNYEGFVAFVESKT